MKEEPKRKKASAPSSLAVAEKSSFPFAGIGASAGGLAALEGFFDHIPADTGIAFVVIQHLDPKRESILASLLQRHSALTICMIEDGMKAAPNTIYVKPPDFSLLIEHGTFLLHKPDATPASRLVIDEFFRSLAKDQGEHAIAIVLSGAASDGALGVRAIHAAGGLVMAQQEDQAGFASMPKSAIATGVVDFILPVEKMGEELARYVGYSRAVRRQLKLQSAGKREGGDLQQVLDVVRKVTGHDFSGYKKGTVRRRIERRLILHHFDGLSPYLQYLREHPDEAKALFKDLLINVTSFFRDTEPFDILGEEFDRLLAEREADRPVRFWVPGCATGEEAYSLGILLLEAMERLERRFPVKIFATDLNPQNVEVGREGIYPENISADLSEQRLDRYFTRHGNQYRVGGQLREMLIFSVHDLTGDPPFSHLDLVSCRNLLIYMDRALQKKVLPVMHYSLNPGGLLLLGTSEEVGEFAEHHFSVVNRKLKLYRAREIPPARRQLVFSMKPAHRAEPPAEEKRLKTAPALERRRKPRETALRELVESTIMQDYAPAGVLVDGQDTIVYYQGETGRYLTLPQGEANYRVLQRARGTLAEPLQDLLRRVREERRVLSREWSCVLQGDAVSAINLTVKPMPEAGNEALLVTFEERERPPTAPSELSTTDVSRMASLQRELYATRQDLQATIEELETSNEELQSANEVMRSTNEELQSTNEELETSREELQSTNEELETVNSELKRKNDDLILANDDINSLFAATDIGTVILDTKLHIRRFTPYATSLFRLLASDIGRPLTDIATTLSYEEMAADMQEVLHHLEPRSREILSRRGHWYAAHLLPYRTSGNVIAGLILTFTDITSLKMAELAAQEARELAENILSTLPEPFLVLDGNLRVASANLAFYQRFQTPPSATEGVPLFQLGNNQWDIPELRRLLLEIIPTNSTFNDFRVSHVFPTIGQCTMLLNARRVDRGQNGSKSSLILLAFKDISEQRGI